MALFLCAAIFLLAASAQAQVMCPDMKKMSSILSDCIRDMKEESEAEEDLKGVPPCLVQCVMKKMELFDDSGSLDEAKAHGLLESCTIKYENMKGHFEKTKECLEKHGSTLQGSEDLCEGFKEFTDCIFPPVE